MTVKESKEFSIMCRRSRKNVSNLNLHKNSVSILATDMTKINVNSTKKLFLLEVNIIIVITSAIIKLRSKLIMEMCYKKFIGLLTEFFRTIKLSVPAHKYAQNETEKIEFFSDKLFQIVTRP